jgi:16S rRNA (cytosine1402-N4)-methyltransferase
MRADGFTGYHTPVLLDESVTGLAIRPGGIYVDLTYGGGSHSRKITEQLGKGMLIAFDQDPAVKDQLIHDRRFRFVQHNFRFFRNYLNYMGISKVDGILADLGVSASHLDNPARGFSFRFDADLDMRMNPHAAQPASDMVNNLSEEEMTGILRKYGEVDQPARIAGAIIGKRKTGRITRTAELADLLRPLFPRNKENKMLAQVFQAFRIAVNHETESLEAMLQETPHALKTGGRLVVISYHSLEDRLVKNYMRAGHFSGKIQTDVFGNPLSPFSPVNRKVIVPQPSEIRENPRSRSARLRIAERTEYLQDV